MAQHMIYTIGRQFGSGGREIGKKLAEELGIGFYDKELLTLAAKESGLSEELFVNNDEKPTNSLLYALAMGSYQQQMPLNHKIFMAQFDAIRNIARKEPCVIVGRCADYALQDMKNSVHVFVTASMEARLARITKLYDVPEKHAKGTIARADRQRANYYNFYTNKGWNDCTSYELCIDSSMTGIDGAVKIIREYAKAKTAFIGLD